MPRKLDREARGGLEAEHFPQRRAPEVGLDQQHPMFAQLGKRQSQVRGERRLSLARLGAGAENDAGVAAVDQALPEEPEGGRRFEVPLLPEDQAFVVGGLGGEAHERDAAPRDVRDEGIARPGASAVVSVRRHASVSSLSRSRSPSPAPGPASGRDGAQPSGSPTTISFAEHAVDVMGRVQPIVEGGERAESRSGPAGPTRRRPSARP
jgi:hypothetical protein